MRSRLPVNIQTLRKMNLFSVRETLKAIKPEIVDITQKFGCNAVDIERIVVQWRNISHIDWKNKNSTIEFWSDVCEFKDCAVINPFHELASLVMSILCLPHSNAEVERVFSQINK